MTIRWLTENVDFPDVISKEIVEPWLAKVAEAHGKIPGTLTYILTDDEGILRVNRKFLDHDYFTDIITFDYSKRGMVSGDIYISLETVATNAEQFGQNPIRELHRVLAHGLLHLCGINDKGPGEREIMEQHEDRALELLYEML
ncbi:MAG: rRNA maturation RNase YbeY [Muribaculaceae bacterium]|nr:rRNA maturation RNase YbeY [Muribaculaceae bacterium]MDE6228472.1 rRNA maturation RNase YbeY [Muribaculaceae bacterium]